MKGGSRGAGGECRCHSMRCKRPPADSGTFELQHALLSHSLTCSLINQPPQRPPACDPARRQCRRRWQHRQRRRRRGPKEGRCRWLRSARWWGWRLRCPPHHRLRAMCTAGEDERVLVRRHAIMVGRAVVLPIWAAICLAATELSSHAAPRTNHCVPCSSPASSLATRPSLEPR